MFGWQTLSIEGRFAVTTDRDVTKTYSRKHTIQKLERLVESLKEGKAFTIQIAGERLRIPATTGFSIEHDVADGEHELEFQFRWRDKD
ncbi:conserved hypothetical protein [Erythrobacter sp. EC-HK427]|nr:conserved hypothetical protein [Erythrobacter sp. EC-HK427]